MLTLFAVHVILVHDFRHLTNPQWDSVGRENVKTLVQYSADCNYLVVPDAHPLLVSEGYNS